MQMMKNYTGSLGSKWRGSSLSQWMSLDDGFPPPDVQWKVDGHGHEENSKDDDAYDYSHHRAAVVALRRQTCRSREEEKLLDIRKLYTIITLTMTEWAWTKKVVHQRQFQPRHCSVFIQIDTHIQWRTRVTYNGDSYREKPSKLENLLKNLTKSMVSNWQDQYWSSHLTLSKKTYTYIHVPKCNTTRIKV